MPSNIVDDPIGYLYQNILGRAPDAAGQQYYKDELGKGLTNSDLYFQMSASPEAQAYRQAGAPAGGVGGTSGAGGQGGFGFSSNPYLGAQSDAIRAQQSQLFGDMNNQIRSDSVATGGYGGSREGVAQGVAMARAATGMDSALAGMYGDAYNQDQNRGLAQYQGDQSFYNGGRALDQSGAALGANLYGLGVQGQWSPYSNFANTMGPFTGFGQTTQSQGGGAMGAFGGVLGGAQIGNVMSGGGNSNNFFNPYNPGSNGSGNSGSNFRPWGF